MREIKFRAFDKYKSCYFRSDNYHNLGSFFTHIESLKSQGHSIILEQFTGLFDKYGKAIFEGDILCWERYQNTNFHCVWVVEMNPLKPYKTWSSTDDDNGVIVIGNKIFNPELLNNQ